jgi:FtsP/CotA-like multicopper oxidase with cupredoxin domain
VPEQIKRSTVPVIVHAAFNPLLDIALSLSGLSRKSALYVVHASHASQNPLAKPQWRDTAIVERKGGTLTFRSRFLDYTGIFMLYCHMMNHEEMGMMQTVKIYK